MEDGPGSELPFRGCTMLLSGGGVSDNLEVVQAENGIMRRALRSKTEGLVILSKEVEGLREELARAKALTSQLGEQLGATGEEQGLVPSMPLPSLASGGFSTSAARERNRIQLHRQLRGRNLALQQERDALRLQLEEARGDVAMWRERVAREREVGQGVAAGEEERAREKEAREERVREMEEVQVRQARLRQDMQRLLDEREDLVREREDLAGKLHRVTHQLRAVLELDTTGLLDMDHIVMENRYLAERLARTQEEKDLANQMGRRYKEALEGVRAVRSAEASREHVRGLLRQHPFPVPQPVDLDSAAGLGTLAASLLETLADRQLQVRHQRLANRELAGRLAALEERLGAVEGGAVLRSPSRLIMQGYKAPGKEDKEEQDEGELQRRVERRVRGRRELGRARQEEREREERERADREERERREAAERERAREEQEESIRRQVEERRPPEPQDPHPRTPTPDYADLNARFENLLGLLDGAGPGEEVRYSCGQPPDLIPRGLGVEEPELEEVSITAGGLQVGGGEEEELPEHIQRLVQRALREMDQ